jgi:hypothetical protein
VAVACRRKDSYEIEKMYSPDNANSLIPELQELSAAGTCLIGFDFPIGLPSAYGINRAFDSWREAMVIIQKPSSGKFFEVSDTPSLQQPFYPKSPGKKGQHRRARLVKAMGFDEEHQLYRTCEQPTDHRRRASCLFWTIGGQQVGRAALHGWQHALLPHRNAISMWPFDGSLAQLFALPKPVIVEMYPAEYYHLINAPRGRWSKRKSADRKALAVGIYRHLKKLGVSMTDVVSRAVDKGFDSEDEFDAFVGLLGMLSVVLGHLPTDPPPRVPDISIEGWIFGQKHSSAQRSIRHR